MMDIDQLQSVRDRERGTDKLQQLRDTFYEETGELLADLRARREQAAAEADDPFSDPTVTRLSDRIDTAERTVEAIYEKRVGKLVKAASFAAADMPTDVEGMTSEERELFETLVADIRANRERVLAVIDGGDPAERGGAESGPGGAGGGSTEAPADSDAGDVADLSESDGVGRAHPPHEPAAPPPLEGDEATGAGDGDGHPADADPAGTAGGPDAGDAGEVDGGAASDPAGSPSRGADGGGAPPEPEADTDGASSTASAEHLDRTTVRITADVGEIFGVDEQEYHLERGDVVRLPAANAEPLLERDAAEPVE